MTMFNRPAANMPKLDSDLQEKEAASALVQPPDEHEWANYSRTWNRSAANYSNIYLMCWREVCQKSIPPSAPETITTINDGVERREMPESKRREQSATPASVYVLGDNKNTQRSCLAGELASTSSL